MAGRGVAWPQVDREGSTPERCSAVESDIFDLFASLGATEAQLDFPVLYASARQGWAAAALPPPGQTPEAPSLAPLLDVILDHVPPPKGTAAPLLPVAHAPVPAERKIDCHRPRLGGSPSCPASVCEPSAPQPLAR